MMQISKVDTVEGDRPSLSEGNFDLGPRYRIERYDPTDSTAAQ
jgi:hypothetical protein